MVYYNIATHFVGSGGLQGFAESTTVRRMKHCIKSAKQNRTKVINLYNMHTKLIYYICTGNVM
jgi:hypothetical protein